MAGKLLSQTFANLDIAGKPTISTGFTCQGESEDKSLANDFKGCSKSDILYICKLKALKAF